MLRGVSDCTCRYGLHVLAQVKLYLVLSFLSPVRLHGFKEETGNASAADDGPAKKKRKSYCHFNVGDKTHLITLWQCINWKGWGDAATCVQCVEFAFL